MLAHGVPVMSRSPDPERAIVHEAADAWVDRCLRRDDSLFTPGRAIWTAAKKDEKEHGGYLNNLVILDLYDQMAR